MNFIQSKLSDILVVIIPETYCMFKILFAVIVFIVFKMVHNTFVIRKFIFVTISFRSYSTWSTYKILKLRLNRIMQLNLQYSTTKDLF